jgi:hypothetical protein
MSDTNHVRIRIARGSKEALEQMRGSLQDGELFWQKSDSVNDGELYVGTEESETEAQ